MSAPPSAPATSRRWWVIGSLGIAAAVGVIAWLSFAGLGERMSYSTVGYRVLDATQVEVRFDVTKPVGRVATCEVRALDARFGVVGSTSVTIPASERATTGHLVTLRTTSEAVTGIVHSCEVGPTTR